MAEQQQDDSGGLAATREGDGGMEGVNQGRPGGMGETSTPAGQGVRQGGEIPDGAGGTVDDPGQSQPGSPADGAPPAGGKEPAEDLANGMEPPD